jgi:hypothetical protein
VNVEIAKRRHPWIDRGRLLRHAARTVVVRRHLMADSLASLQRRHPHLRVKEPTA